MVCQRDKEGYGKRMMRDYDRITHILGAIDDALESTEGIRKEDFLENKDKRVRAAWRGRCIAQPLRQHKKCDNYSLFCAFHKHIASKTDSAPLTFAAKFGTLLVFSLGELCP